jgi:hypothetical protein
MLRPRAVGASVLRQWHTSVVTLASRSSNPRATPLSLNESEGANQSRHWARGHTLCQRHLIVLLQQQRLTLLRSTGTLWHQPSGKYPNSLRRGQMDHLCPRTAHRWPGFRRRRRLFRSPRPRP